MNGVDNSGETITIKYDQGFSSDSYIAEYRGEIFSGKAVMTGNQISYGTFFAGGSIGTGVTSSFSGNIKAILIGNKGSSLKCLMNYADGGLINFGGVGSCVHSSGAQIEVVW